MKTNGNDCASPVSAELIEKQSKGHFNNTGEPNPFGLTKREAFAMAAMQGFISSIDKNPRSMDEILEIPGNTASWAVSFADALIKALNK